jgi:hypothetical protein
MDDTGEQFPFIISFFIYFVINAKLMEAMKKTRFFVAGMHRLPLCRHAFIGWWWYIAKPSLIMSTS